MYGTVFPVRALISASRCFTSKSLGRLGTPRAFKEGETARQMVPSDRLSSATTRFVVRGSNPLSTHSTEA